MVYIPAGEFIMGMKDGDPLGLVWATPQRKVHLPAFYMDRYEVTNREYKKFIDAIGHRHGGAWTSRAGPYAYTMDRTAQPLDYRHRSTGFRCAMPADKEGKSR